MSDHQQQSNGWISWYGRAAGPALALLILWLPSALVGDLAPAAQRTAAVAVWMATWWMTEAIPLPMTALLPLILFPLAGVVTFDEAAAPYANKFVFLFLGGFMIARAVEKWQLHRRIALLTVLAAGTRPGQLIAGFMIATAGLSMWISNTAATVMMLPIGMSLVVLMQDHVGEESVGSENFATCLMLSIAYAASIGGMATLVGTPTNLFLAGFAGDHGIDINFGQWLAFAGPMSVLFLVIAWLLLTRFVYPIPREEIPGGRALIREELRGMGRVSRGEWIVLTVFSLTALAWVFRKPVSQIGWVAENLPWLGQLNDTSIALIGATVLFLIPIDLKRGVFALDWETAITIPWGVLLLFGGGFSLALAVSKSELALWIGNQVTVLKELPLFVLVVVVVALVVFLTELASNTPTAAAFLPILYGVSEVIGVDSMAFLVPATLAATCAFMLPVATPPNAIVFGSGYVEIRSMVRAGVWLNLVSVILIPLWVQLFGGLAFP